MQVVVPHDLLDLNIQALFLGLQEAKNAISGDLQAAMADLEAHMHANFTDVHGAEQINMAKLQASEQYDTMDMQASMFADLQDALQDGMADQMSALKVGLTEIQNSLEIDMSSIWGAIYVGLKQVDTNLQQMHITMLRAASQEIMHEKFRLDDFDEEDNLAENFLQNCFNVKTFSLKAEFEEEGGEMPYVIEDSLDEEYLDVLFMRKRRDSFSTKSV
ncbi:hypothetical protein scyTo_0012487 [Scyliorhinus torazame]|uniref:Uncharacterized protein n=1 Tax=Scyliorhinus torazame TaxID=75743 RepID=A0A401P9L4_SCYTO|nr:hypothetical protein [Scyliorhinus torazame]